MLVPPVPKWLASAATWPWGPTRATWTVAALVAWLPPTKSSRVVSPAGVVSMYSSPASASLPHTALCGPLTSSTRAAPAKLKCAKSTSLPVAGLFSSMPSNITRR